MHCPVFKRGDKVKCHYADGYYGLKEGKVYSVFEYQPSARYEGSGFQWPAYVVFVWRNYQGRLQKSMCHASRFTLVAEGETKCTP